jgi:hypothetical protein
MRAELIRYAAAALMLMCSPWVLAETSNWKEDPTPPAPAWSKANLIPIDLRSAGSLVFGVDPLTISVGSDEVVRYVMVAYNPEGSTNALFEGLRCNTSEIKTYARSSTADKWQTVAQPEWAPLDPTKASHRHAIALARQGFCEGASLGARNAAELIKRLKSSRNP